MIDAGYTRTMKIPLKAGREFNPGDTQESRKVLIVNETMADRLWPGQNPLGQIALNGREEWQVVGVVGNVRHSALEQEAGMEMYFPMTQNHDWGSMDLVIRGGLPMESLVPSVRARLQTVDPDLPTSDFKTLDQLIDQSVSPRRFVTFLLGGFSVLALILASLGIYGVVSYSVNQRINEIGIRIALGARPAAILRLAIGRGVGMTLIGLAAGLGAGLILTRAVSSLLFGVTAVDPITFGSIAFLLGSVALLACFIPARRATQFDPIIALRCD